MGLGGWGGRWAGLTEVSEGRVAIFPHPSAAAQQAVGPQPTKCSRGGPSPNVPQDMRAIDSGFCQRAFASPGSSSRAV